MIQAFVDRFMESKPALREKFSAKHPSSYRNVVEAVIEVLHGVEDPGDWFSPDPKRIHEIDDGDYQGTLLYLIAADSYQPSVYWYVLVGYGSCSGCDTLESIRCYTDEPPTEDQIDQYMTLALHIVQRLKRIGDV